MEVRKVLFLIWLHLKLNPYNNHFIVFTIMKTNANFSIFLAFFTLVILQLKNIQDCLKNKTKAKNRSVDKFQPRFKVWL